MQGSAKISKLWWEHLAPKALVKRHKEVERLLSRFIQSDYGNFWFNAAKKPEGVIRCKRDQYIPVLKLIFVGDAPGVIAKFEYLQKGHRTVSTQNEFESGKVLEDDELVMVPLISVDLVTDTLLIEAARKGISSIDESKIIQPSLLFTIPAHYLLSPQHFPLTSYVLYQHIFGRGNSYPNDGYFYVGVTTRSWQTRWAEHQRAIKNGSPLLFHRKFREESQNGGISYVNHKVMAITDNIDALYEAEEFLVEGHWQDERRLNMIPGGKSGLRYLRENGLIAKSVVPIPDQRDPILSKWFKEHPRKGLPAPWVAEKWRDNDWAIAQICGRDGRLSAEQVRAIRQLANEYTAEEIYSRIGAKDVGQVLRVLDGQTYTRVV